jgi:hypothetical protein
MKHYILILLISLFTFNSCIDEPTQFPDTAEGNFDALWHIIDTRYCYLDYKNINWDSIYTVYKARLPEAQNNIRLFDLFGAMLAELRDGHVNLYSSFDRSRYEKFFTDSAANYYPAIIQDHYIENGYFRKAGGLSYARLKNHNIGYIHYRSFVSNFSNTNMANIMDYFSDCDGLILDVRDNDGGSVSNAELLASYFFKEKTLTGFTTYRNGPGHADFSKPSEVHTPAHKTINWSRPVAVLTNRLSYSATTDFAVRMKHAPNAFSAGSWTGGGGGLPISSELPNGWMVRFSTGPMLDIRMNHTEWGIAPDFHVIISDEDKANKVDAVIEKAIEVIGLRAR